MLPTTQSQKVRTMFPTTLSLWIFSASFLASSSALADSASAPRSSFVAEPLQERPRPPQAALDACSGKDEGDECTVEFRGQTLEGTCRQLPEEDDLVCLPAGPPPGRPGS